MILPSKHLPQDRVLLTVGAAILRHLSHPIAVSALWEEMRHPVDGQEGPPHLRYDAFVLTLDMLFLVGALDLREGILHRRTS